LGPTKKPQQSKFKSFRNFDIEPVVSGINKAANELNWIAPGKHAG